MSARVSMGRSSARANCSGLAKAGVPRKPPRVWSGPSASSAGDGFGQPPVDDFDGQRLSLARFARPDGQHEVGRFEVAMHHPAGFGGHQRADHLFGNL